MSETKSSAYKRAGVDLGASDRTLGLIKDAVKRTYTPNVLAGLGAFGGLFDAGEVRQQRPAVQQGDRPAPRQRAPRPHGQRDDRRHARPHHIMEPKVRQ